MLLREYLESILERIAYSIVWIKSDLNNTCLIELAVEIGPKNLLICPTGRTLRPTPSRYALLPWTQGRAEFLTHDSPLIAKYFSLGFLKP